MPKQIYFFIFIANVFPILAFTQIKNTEDNFVAVVWVVKGDLNKDKLQDSVVVLKDTTSENNPYRLQIFF